MSKFSFCLIECSSYFSVSIVYSNDSVIGAASSSSSIWCDLISMLILLLLETMKPLRIFRQHSREVCSMTLASLSSVLESSSDSLSVVCDCLRMSTEVSAAYGESL